MEVFFMLRIAVCGVMGRMGSRIASLIMDDPELELSGAVEVLGHARTGTDVGTALGFGTIGINVSDDLEKVIEISDCVIDFSAPGPTLEHMHVSAAASTPVVIGTTGMQPAQIREIKKASRKVPVVMAPNMSVGVNVLFRLVSEAARYTPGYDIEIVETHHRLKKDAPSGTALGLGKVITDTLGRDFKRDAKFARHGHSLERKENEIGIQSLRAGDVVGEHTVIFAGPGERLELTHRAHSRDNLARGAIIAAKWVVGRKSGLFDMQDVFGLREC
jgi:4-hydroxy-tetrahydrodipicolinate reductase